MSFNLSSGEVKNLSEISLKNFVKHVLLVTKKIEDRKDARDALIKHLQKIKKEAKAKKTKKTTLNKYLAELDNKVQDVLNKEAKMLRSQEYESRTIQQLRKKIDELEEMLLQKDVENQNLMNINRENIQTMQISMNALRHQLGEYIGSQTQRERKMRELENKIKAKYQEPSAIKRLEQKYMDLKNKSDTSQEVLDKLRGRIQLLREKSRISS